MAITQEFKQAVKDNDTLMIRIMLKDSLVVDPTFEEFNQMISLSEGNLLDLYEEHDGEALKYDVDLWTKNYMDEQMIQVVYNFSKVRIELLKRICKHLYGERAQKIEKERIVSSNRNQISQKQIGTGMVVGGVLATVVGITVAKSVVVVAGVAFVVVGGVLIITDK
ncbi:hypothetical protein [Alkaliphilus peptidifermentans]|uniref:Uncharacterized protein n=1 Tax=Alkaliphilus peptidifermentans DSM 18978 TaxID=1120976 RepID=A0A1G5EB11_9FIRM|nr:hypothetical protein [Alkaliphilus peptidifermentans]SCY24146.1 hypothetical protein SAMN03080606_01104 [Alkaliphilus peptidifermentans DSM 18978]